LRGWINTFERAFLVKTNIFRIYIGLLYNLGVAMDPPKPHVGLPLPEVLIRRANPTDVCFNEYSQAHKSFAI
jgi:hypothetical protein